MERKTLEELNLRFQTIKNGLDAIKTINEFITFDKQRKIVVDGISYDKRKELEMAKINIMDELLKLDEFKTNGRFFY